MEDLRFSPNFSTDPIKLNDKESPIRKILTTELDFFQKKGIATAVAMAITMALQYH
jgi:hypothetical protein